MATDVGSVVTDSCLCCPEPGIESRLQYEAATAICCGLPAPIDGYGDTRFSAFAYDTEYTVRTYNSTNPADFSETTCTRSRSRTGDDYAFSNDGLSAPVCDDSSFTDTGCTTEQALPSCGSVSPNVGVQCISGTVDTETSSTTVDCGDEAVSAIALANKGIIDSFESSSWLTVTSGMADAESGYGDGLYYITKFQIRKVGYPVPCWIVLTIERTDLDSNVTYLEDTIFMAWGETSTTYDLEPTYGEFLRITDVKVYCAPKEPPP